MTHTSRARGARTSLFCLLLFLAVCAFPRRAVAEKVISKVGSWEIFSDGRAGGFVSWVYGDGLPAFTYQNSVDTGNAVVIRTAQGGGFSASREQHPINDPSLHFEDPAHIPPDQGTVNMVRVR